MSQQVRTKLIAALFALILHPPVASAVELGAGLAAVDSMDNRMEPAASARIGWTAGLYSQFYYWGRDFGPVAERNAVLTFAWSASMPAASFVFAHYGFAASEHDFSLYANQASREHADAPDAKHDREFNLGGVLGVEARAKTGPVTYSVNWDSHIFPTGSPFIVYLTSARKQTVSFVLGVEL